MHSRAGTSAIKGGKSTPLSAALDLQNAAASLKDAALSVQRIAITLEQVSHSTNDKYPVAHCNVISFEPQEVSDVRMISKLTKEDVEAANILSSMRAGMFSTLDNPRTVAMLTGYQDALRIALRRPTVTRNSQRLIACKMKTPPS